MRVFLFSSAYAPQIGGVETVTRRLAAELGANGHDIWVYTNRYPRSLPAYEEIDGIPVTRRLYPNILPSPGSRPLLAVVKQVLALPLAALELFYLWRQLGRLRPDVVNVHYFSYPAAYVMLAARLRRLPVVLCFHGSDVAASPYPASYHWTMPWACSMAQVVITCSENLLGYLRQDLSPAESSKATVSHYGVDLPATLDTAAQTLLPDGLPETFALVPSRLVEKKSVDVAIAAVAVLKRRAIRVELVIAGDGPLRERLEAQTREQGVSDEVTFLGSVDHDAAIRLMRRASFVVVPSSWEAFGQVCLEAMAAGKAVIGSANGGITEIVQHGKTGLLVPPDDPEELAQAIGDLAGDPGRSTEMGIAGRRRAAEAFTWGQMVDRYHRAFDLARDRSGPGTEASPV